MIKISFKSAEQFEYKKQFVHWNFTTLLCKINYSYHNYIFTNVIQIECITTSSWFWEKYVHFIEHQNFNKFLGKVEIPEQALSTIWYIMQISYNI